MNGRSLIYNKNESLIIQQIASTINFHTSYDNSEFSLFIPGNMCSVVFKNNYMIYDNTSYLLNSKIKLGRNIFCNNTNKTINVSMYRIAPNEFLLT
ncbi:MAG: hypothetical protein ACP5LH_00125 [Candidatus Micrarchaeia archaeon]